MSVCVHKSGGRVTPRQGGVALIWQFPRAGAAAFLQPGPLWSRPVAPAEQGFLAGGKVSSGSVPGEGRVRSPVWPGSLLKDSGVGLPFRPGATTQPALGNCNVIFSKV